MTPPSNPPPFYPVYTHRLSRCYKQRVPLSARSLSALTVADPPLYKDGEKIMHLRNHPVEWVGIVGVVVAVDERSWGGREMVVCVDDGSGGAGVECVVARGRKTPNGEERERERGKERERCRASVERPDVDWGEVDVGRVVKVGGRPVECWGRVQVRVARIKWLRATDDEVCWWAEVRRWEREVLIGWWVLSERRVERERLRVLGKSGRRAKGEEKGKGKGKGEGERVDGEVGGKDGGIVQGEHNKPDERNRQEDEERRMEKLKKRRRSTELTGLGSKNKANYPSLATKMRCQGQYDALGI